ncbi:YciI family protein [Luteimonas sp. M1R5S18]|jgi:hypothetical protein|uniref:YciI family protein n=1 Tax=Luteimonas rhizosphaericola TaxID=3042024 RepID=A0ABT6JLL5_9GAMM|nr:YciI family protein [Luteimonas rhizosphaericola]MDH5831562.1 YciI family protein [Luteimonas rhizosphaericola]
MQYLLLVYTDESLIEALPEGDYDRRMRHCLEHADELKASGTLLGFQQLEPAKGAKSVRRRGGKVSVVDGPFAETKEMLAGFNLVEADSMEDALRLAQQLPWADTGCIEVREVRNVDAVRQRVGARPAAA